MWIKVFIMGLDLIALVSAIYMRSVLGNEELMKQENQKLLERYREGEMYKDKTDEEIMEQLEQLDKVGKTMLLFLIVFLMFGFAIFGQYL